MSIFRTGRPELEKTHVSCPLFPRCTCMECFRHPCYRAGDLPESERASREVLALPVYPELEEEQVRYVAEQVLAAVA